MDCLFLPKCVLLQSPGFGVVLNVRKKKQQACILESRRSGYVISSLSVTQTGSDILVKEKTEFKSSFDEYLKAMESIRADRDKTKDQKEGGGDRKKLKDVAFTKNAPKNPRQEESRTWKRSKGSEFDKKDEMYERSSAVAAKPRPSGVFHKRVAVSSQKEINHKKSKDYSSENVSMDMTAVKSSKHIWKKSMPMDEMSNDNELKMNHKRSKDYSSENVRMGMTAVKSSKRVWKKSMPIDEMSNDDDLEMEKFIFEPSELNGDGLGGRRISQMEMEERIQKLAICLNEANVKMPEWMFSKTMRSARVKFSDHSIMRIIQILGKMGNWRMVLQLVEWLQMQERYMSRKIGYVYTAALGVLGKARRPVEALNLFSSMQRHRSSYPDIVAYHSISVTLGQAGHMKELFDVIDSMRSIPANFKIEDSEDWDPRLEPDLVIYNAVLNACVTRKEWEGAFWVLQKLAEIDQQPSNTTYGLLMEVMLACGKYDLVHEFFRQMQASFAPNALTYRVLVNTLWREGKPEEAITAVQEMESRGLVGSASLYYDLARCLCSAGRCEEALMQVDKICKVASKPLVVTYTGLMQACFDSGNVEDGIFIFKHMQKYCSPNQVTCNMMLKAYLGHGMFTEAKELFQKMLQSGQQGSRANSGITADIHTFSLMLESCVKENRWDDFDYAYNQMLHHGYSFNTKRHLWMVVQASKAGKDEVVETTWRHLMKSKFVPPPALVKERFRLKMENDDLVAAMSSVASHPSSDQKSFSKKAWSKLLEDNAHRFNKEALMRLIREINVSMSNSELPNLIFQNLRDSCAEFVGLEPITGTTQLNETPVEVCI
ncbi:pentatricopeptide repeat-containing protein At1g30610, chloroplastic [Silene latifolia]|uniref:pentatricopeptide repeat-containing protein At1g30610, chloroplastic n=1 Tax=Silene latifolia TaxID=37657 RepID=UPI003D78279C